MDPTTEQCPWCASVISRSKFLEIQARIRTEEAKKLASAKAALQAELEEKHRLALRKELSRQRQLLQQETDHAALRLQAQFQRERDGFQKKLKDLERRLERRTAHEAGEGAELDLFEALREAFPADRITRIQKGQPGADILHQVLYKGEICGRIVIDSKNRQAWQNTFVMKLRADQAAAGADHAILSSTVFPSGARELLIQDGVIVVSPARVVPIVELLRKAAVQMHVLGLSLDQRVGKMSRLYGFITSQEYSRRFGELDRLADDLLDLDVDESKEHQRVWRRRGTLVTRLKNAVREIDTEVAAILESAEEQEPVAQAV